MPAPPPPAAARRRRPQQASRRHAHASLSQRPVSLLEAHASADTFHSAPPARREGTAQSERRRQVEDRLAKDLDDVKKEIDEHREHLYDVVSVKVQRRALVCFEDTSSRARLPDPGGTCARQRANVRRGLAAPTGGRDAVAGGAGGAAAQPRR
jgi:hypothetical protein